MLPRFPATLLETILTHLTKLFLAGAPGDTAAARQAAQEFLATYHPRNAHELRLAAQVISFSLQALAALGQASDPDLPLTRVMRLRGSAVSLNRESEKAQRRLDQCQQTSLADSADIEIQSELAQPQPAAAEPASQPATRPLQTASAVVPNLSTTPAYDHDQTELRIAASLKRAEARVAAIEAAERAIATP
jgi:hypothetical protein